MTNDAHIWMLAIVFVAQIMVISFISPARVSTAFRLLQERFPPAQYPRLFPISADETRRWQQARQWLHLSIGCAGFVVLVAALFTVEHFQRFALVLVIYSLVQLSPTFVYSAWQRRILKEAAKMAPPAKRTASLDTSRITDFVSPLSIALGFIVTTCALATAIYLFVLSTKETAIFVVSAIVSIFLLSRMLQRTLLPLSFSRPDPYMSQQDLFRGRQKRLRLLFIGAISMSTYLTFMMLYAAHFISFDQVYIAMGVSVLMQAISLRFSSSVVRSFELTDFSVYRDPGALPEEDRPSVA